MNEKILYLAIFSIILLIPVSNAEGSTNPDLFVSAETRPVGPFLPQTESDGFARSNRPVGVATTLADQFVGRLQSRLSKVVGAGADDAERRRASG